MPTSSQQGRRERRRRSRPSLLSVAMEHGRGSGSEFESRRSFAGAYPLLHRQLGLHLEGDSANTYWGVLDALVITDFPDM